MPIDFYCTGCSRLLRTPDGSAGRQAKCPQCGALVAIPAESVTPGASLGEGGTSPFGPERHAPTDAQGFNPYASPETTSLPVAPAVAKGELVHSRIDFDDTMRSTWRFFMDNIGPLALFGLMIFGMNIALQLLGGVGEFVSRLTQNQVILVGFMVVNMLVSFGLQTYINLGTVNFMLKMARTRRANLSDFFQANRLYLRALGLNIVLLVLVGGTFLACLIPGALSLAMQDQALTIAFFAIGGTIGAVLAAILALRYALLSFYFMVDREMGVFDALSASAEFMQGNKLTALLILIVVSMLGGLFVCLTCVVCFTGQILYVSYFGLLTAIIYLSATGQPWDKPVTIGT